VITHFSILAQGEDPTLKIIIGVVFAGIWILAQVLSAWNERQKKKQRQQKTGQTDLPSDVIVPIPAPRREKPAQSSRRNQAPPRTQAPPRNQPPARSQPPRIPQQARQQANLPPRRTAPPPPMQKPRPVAQESQSTPAMSAKRQQAQVAAEDLAEASGSSAPVATSSSGIPQSSARIRSLLRPRNLRKEFILTEILQPPVGIRAAIDR